MPIESINPSTGEIVATYEEASSDEVAAIVERADRAFRDWRRTGFDHRAGLMHRAGAVLRERTQEYAALMAREMGKPIGEARGEIGRGIDLRRRPRRTRTAIDPDRREAQLRSRHDVVVAALGDVQHLARLDAVRLEVGEHELEVALVGLVAADVLGRVYRIEFDAEFTVRSGKSRPAHIGEDHQFVVCFQMTQGIGRIGKGRPVRQGIAKALIKFGCALQLEILGNRAMNASQDIRV